MKNRTFSPTKLLVICACFSLAVVGLLQSCDSAGSINRPLRADYNLNGALVIDLNRDTSNIIADLRFDSSATRTGTIRFGSDTVRFDTLGLPQDSLFRFGLGSSNPLLSQTRALSIQNGNGLSVSINQAVPGPFAITQVAPVNRISNGNDPVSVNWTASANAETYVLATVRRNRVYQREGFSHYVTSQSTAEFIIRDAFYQTDGVNLDTGWYYIYVYAISGSPDSAMTEFLLPAPLPSQLSDNIDERELSGHFGSVVVSFRDSIRQATQP
ncbi:MAG: hypothetical protein SGI97_08410 [candidate division Zixibacteria bacterium]|nr:hypothetical protein [candidate division Zixibacteria bacterium]